LEKSVPRFYFDVREDGNVIRDENGLEFGSLEAAEREAVQCAAEIGRDRLPKGDTREISVEVRDEHGERALTVTVSLNVRREAFVLAYAGGISADNLA
jgi:hypothetical protein